MNNFTDEIHCRYVANYFSSKLKEFHYYLNEIVIACDKSLSQFTLQINDQEENKRNSQIVIYSFSSFTNLIQTLKDATETFIKPNGKLPWSEIKVLRNGRFLYEARNAATHDGNPVISAWVDGKYYVPAKILRLDKDKKVKEIFAPRDDIRKVCLEFSVDYCNLLSRKLSEVGTDLSGSILNPTDYEYFMSSEVIPYFAKELFFNNLPQLQNQIKSVEHDPIKIAMANLNDVTSYCQVMLDK